MEFGCSLMALIVWPPPHLAAQGNNYTLLFDFDMNKPYLPDLPTPPKMSYSNTAAADGFIHNTPFISYNVLD